MAIVQYRESDLAPFPAQIEDTKTAIRFLRKHHEEYFIENQHEEEREFEMVFIFIIRELVHKSTMTK